MPDYKKMYFRLFNALTDILSALEKHDIATAKQLIQHTEELYMNA